MEYHRNTNVEANKEIKNEKCAEWNDKLKYLNFSIAYIKLKKIETKATTPTKT